MKNNIPNHIQINNFNFHALCLDEGKDFYGSIYSLDVHDFNNWVRVNLKELGTINSRVEVLPDVSFYEKLCKKGYLHKYQQCHYAAKAATILNEEILYYTGFLTRICPYGLYPVITHSFNKFQNRIIDLTKILDPKNPISEIEFGFPNIYYGIQVKREFVLQYKEEVLKKNSMRPLLYEWYLENNNTFKKS